MKLLRRLYRLQSGQSLVELVLLTPLLLILVIGVVEMGRYASLSILVGNAARAGAQYGAESLANAANTTGIQCAAQNESLTAAPACPSSNPIGLTVTSIDVCGCDDGGTIIPATETHAACTTTCTGSSHLVVSVQVTASGTFNPLFNYTNPLFGYLAIKPITVSSTASERVAQ